MIEEKLRDRERYCTYKIRIYMVKHGTMSPKICQFDNPLLWPQPMMNVGNFPTFSTPASKATPMPK